MIPAILYTLFEDNSAYVASLQVRDSSQGVSEIQLIPFSQIGFSESSFAFFSEARTMTMAPSARGLMSRRVNGSATISDFITSSIDILAG